MKSWAVNGTFKPGYSHEILQSDVGVVGYFPALRCSLWEICRSWQEDVEVNVSCGRCPTLWILVFFIFACSFTQQALVTCEVCTFPPSGCSQNAINNQQISNCYVIHSASPSDLTNKVTSFFPHVFSPLEKYMLAKWVGPPPPPTFPFDSIYWISHAVLIISRTLNQQTPWSWYFTFFLPHLFCLQRVLLRWNTTMTQRFYFHTKQKRGI